MYREVRESLKIDRGVRQVCVISLWLLNEHMDEVVKERESGIEQYGSEIS